MKVKALCNGVVETLGRVRYDGKVKHPFTAHPKVDPVTGDLCPAYASCLHNGSSYPLCQLMYTAASVFDKVLISSLLAQPRYMLHSGAAH